MKLIWILISHATTFIWAIKFPNDIQGSPTIECGQDTIIINVVTANNNASRIFAKGHYGDSRCSFQSTNSATFSLSNCGMTRQRQLEPRGLSYDIIVVVQLHPMFITKVDRAYNLKCFYLEAVKFVTSNLEVSMISTDLITAGSPMPQCTYGLHLESANGPLVKYAKVGDKVFHVWECPSDVYGILVHSCYVTDGQGNNFQIVDQNGCGVDKYVIRTPEYSNELTKSQQETHVFKFADRMVVFFNCQIKLCVKATGGCSGISPPDCSSFGKIESTTKDTTTTFPSPPTFGGDNLSANISSINDSHAENSTSGNGPKIGLSAKALLHNNSEEYFIPKSNIATLDTNDTLSLDIKNEINSYENETEFHNAFYEINTHQANMSVMEQMDNNTVTEMTQLLETDNDSFRKDINSNSILSDRQKIPFVKVILALSNFTKQNESHFVDPLAEEGSGEDVEGFLLLSKNSTTTKDHVKRQNKAGFAPLQRDEPNLRKLRRLPETTYQGVDLETDVNQQMWVLEPEESGPEADDRNQVADAFPSGRFKILENKNENELHICMPGWGFGFIIVSFVVLLIILILSVFYIGAKKSRFNTAADNFVTPSNCHTNRI